MSSEKASIIIPVYDVEQYLAECLNSAIRQDHDHHETAIPQVIPGNTANKTGQKDEVA